MPSATAQRPKPGPACGRSRKASSLRSRTSPTSVRPCDRKLTDATLAPSGGLRRHAGRVQRVALAAGEGSFVEIVDQLMEQAVPVDLRLEVEEDRAEPDRGAVHEDKGARRRDAAQSPDVAVYVVDEAAAVAAGRRLFLDHSGAV